LFQARTEREELKEDGVGRDHMKHLTISHCLISKLHDNQQQKVNGALRLRTTRSFLYVKCSPTMFSSDWLLDLFSSTYLAFINI
jgi:hypothetical protein